MKRDKKDKGCIVAFSFTKGSYEEAIRAKKDGLEIILMTVQELLDKKYDSLLDK